ncbi:alpha/beta hydrolase [Pseudarthrobacter sp. NPDC080039]|uniref:alpha/beta fold hydrolase n=1 Tax=unclassified Pseudarthrobacter TaxID=2647000 RepID=UPI00344F7F11
MKTQEHAVTRTPITDLYCEVRGDGPAVLMVPGATGDAGHFTKTAEILSDEFTVITYDRRGNSRSTEGADRDGSATMGAQADDAAALIADCGLEKALVFGTSGGAIITLELVTRHPQRVSAAVIHEPPLVGLLPPSDEPNPLDAVFRHAETNPRGALQEFIALNASPTALNGVDPATRERLFGNAEHLFGKEVMGFLGYQPDADALQRSAVPLTLLRSIDGLPFAPMTNGWLAAHLGLEEHLINLRGGTPAVPPGSGRVLTMVGGEQMKPRRVSTT